MSKVYWISSNKALSPEIQFQWEHLLLSLPLTSWLLGRQKIVTVSLKLYLISRTWKGYKVNERCHMHFSVFIFQGFKRKRKKYIFEEWMQYFWTIFIPSVLLSLSKSTELCSDTEACVHIWKQRCKLKRTKSGFVLCHWPRKMRLMPGVRCNHKSLKSSQEAAEPMRTGKALSLPLLGFV